MQFVSYAGRLLVATPLLTDPNFRRAVVLIAAHDERGALGFVINRPPEAPLDPLLAGWRSLLPPPDGVFAGGPVQPAYVLGLALRSERATPSPAWTTLEGRLGLLDPSRATPDDLDAFEAVRFFAGHAGWGGGQLDAEVATDAWWVVDARPGDAFSTQPEGRWRAVLARQRWELAIYAGFPSDPRQN
jgi:putative transcriptional regulator